MTVPTSTCSLSTTTKRGRHLTEPFALWGWDTTHVGGDVEAALAHLRQGPLRSGAARPAGGRKRPLRLSAPPAALTRCGGHPRGHHRPRRRVAGPPRTLHRMGRGRLHHPSRPPHPFSAPGCKRVAAQADAGTGQHSPGGLNEIEKIIRSAPGHPAHRRGPVGRIGVRSAGGPHRRGRPSESATPMPGRCAWPRTTACSTSIICASSRWISPIATRRTPQNSSRPSRCPIRPPGCPTTAACRCLALSGEPEP